MLTFVWFIVLYVAVLYEPGVKGICLNGRGKGVRS
jgi:hypothetical protein